MKIQVTVLRDCLGSDTEAYIPLVDALVARGHAVDFVRHEGVSAYGRAVAEFDVPCDLHLMCMHYARPLGTAYRAADLPRAGKVVYYICQDGHQIDVDCTNIQLFVLRDRADMTIQGPFGVRPWFARDCGGIPDMPKEIDIFFSGIGWTAPDGRTRWEWLEQFRGLLPPGINLVYARPDQARYPPRQFAEMAKKSKICLSLWGIAEHCYRYWEIPWIGSCVAGQRFIRERPWRDINSIMPNFVEPAEAVDVCTGILGRGTWDEIARAQNAWYHQNYNEATYREWANETASIITGE